MSIQCMFIQVRMYIHMHICIRTYLYLCFNFLTVPGRLSGVLLACKPAYLYNLCTVSWEVCVFACVPTYIHMHVRTYGVRSPRLQLSRSPLNT